MPRYYGDDTKTRITILDEDFPGTLCFHETQISVSKNQERVELKILRLEGSDGKISCIVRTAACVDVVGLNMKNAVDFEDYLPYKEKIVFNHGENEKTITITLV